MTGSRNTEEPRLTHSLANFRIHCLHLPTVDPLEARRFRGARGVGDVRKDGTVSLYIESESISDPSEKGEFS